MDDGGDHEGEQFGQEAVLYAAFGETAGVDVDEVVQPVVDNNIPLPIIRPKLDRIPPIRVEAPIREPGDLGPQIDPTMQEPEEPENQEESRRQHQLNNRKRKGRNIQLHL